MVSFLDFCISSHAYEAGFTLEYEILPWFMLELDRLYTITLVSINMCGKFIKKYISVAMLLTLVLLRNMRYHRGLCWSWIDLHNYTCFGQYVW